MRIQFVYSTATVFSQPSSLAFKSHFGVIRPYMATTAAHKKFLRNSRNSGFVNFVAAPQSVKSSVAPNFQFPAQQSATFTTSHHLRQFSFPSPGTTNVSTQPVLAPLPTPQPAPMFFPSQPPNPTVLAQSQLLSSDSGFILQPVNPPSRSFTLPATTSPRADFA